MAGCQLQRISARVIGYSLVTSAMNRPLFTSLALFAISCGFAAERPRHLFRADGPLTMPSASAPAEIALNYIKSIGNQYQLSSADIDSLYVVKEYRTAHNGLTHLVFKQHYNGIDVYNAEWVV